jgi:hypothetical protein
MSDKRTGTNSERIHRRDEQDRSSPVTWYARAVKGVADVVFPRFVRAFTVAIGVIAGAAAPSLAAAPTEAPVEFIRGGANDVLAEMRSAASLDEKEAYFRQVLRQDFDMDGISQFVLGRIGAARARSSSKSSEPSWKNTSCSPTVGALQRPAVATST